MTCYAKLERRTNRHRQQECVVSSTGVITEDVYTADEMFRYMVFMLIITSHFLVVAKLILGI